MTEFDAALTALGIKQRSAAQWFHTSERNIRRWKSGTRKTPPGVMVTVRLMMAGKVGPADVELAAASISARTNGGTESELLVSLEEPPAPLEEALAPEQPAPVADLAPTTAERIFALGAGMCRWPFGSPGTSNFYFCSDSIAAGSYCKRHYAEACAAPRRFGSARDIDDESRVESLDSPCKKPSAMDK
jgi:hypothetical protein